jgi:MFS family permease
VLRVGDGHTGAWDEGAGGVNDLTCESAGGGLRPGCFSAYFLFSLPWSKFVNRTGYHRTMVVGLLTMACGAFLFLPAASYASYALFLTALLILAAGIAGLQVAANPYVDLLGKPETASSRLNLTQAFNSLGTAIAPKIGGLLILSAAPLAVEQLLQLTPQALHAYRIQEADTVRMPYAVIALALVLLAILIGADCGMEFRLQIRVTRRTSFHRSRRPVVRAGWKTCGPCRLAAQLRTCAASRRVCLNHDRGFRPCLVGVVLLRI